MHCVVELEFTSKKLNDDLIFMDIQLPNMKSIQACKIIKGTYPSIPVIPSNFMLIIVSLAIVRAK
ncbi:MAG: CheY-like chemotaxis protein [Alteromonadaceae bacterium]|jgi:CheY-like chemotaxis protein